MVKDESLQILYVPIGSLEEAKVLARHLLEKKLIACANIIPGMTSVYQWQGRIEEENELVIIFKTTKEKSKNCMDTIEKIHPYDTPCVLKITSTECNKDYLSWAQSQIGDS